MAYQNVGVPRFYVNVLEWLASNNVITLPSDHFRTLSVNPTFMANWTALTGSAGAISVPSDAFSQNCFLAILGHSYSSSSIGANIYTDPYGAANTTYSNDIQINVGVANSSQGSAVPTYDGFSIGSLTGSDIAGFVYNAEGSVGSVILGTYYDMINAPNLSLTMSREYGGTKEFTTHNGSSMSNTMWSKPPSWGNLGAWEMSNDTSQWQNNRAFTKSGRRTWQLKFSYIDDGDLWGSNQALSISRQDLSDGIDDDDTGLPVTTNYKYNILTDYNFFSQVWHKTLGGTLPFIFQPDSSNFNPDQFCIARFKNNSLKATQSAPNLYDISLSIEEAF